MISLTETTSVIDPNGRIQRGGGGGKGGPDPPEKSQNIGFLSNTGPDPLKITKLPIKHSM